MLEAEKRGSALKNRLVGDAEMHKGLFERETLRSANEVKYFKDTLRKHLTEGVRVYSYGDFINLLEHEEETLRWSSGSQVFTAFEAPARRLDGHVAVVFHERRTKTNQNQADVTQENVERHR